MEYINVDDVRASFLCAMILGCVVWSAAFLNKDVRGLTAAVFNIKETTASVLSWLLVPPAYYLYDMPDQIMYWIHGSAVIYQEGLILIQWKLEEQGIVTYLGMFMWASCFVFALTIMWQAAGTGMTAGELWRSSRESE